MSLACNGSFPEPLFFLTFPLLSAMQITAATAKLKVASKQQVSYKQQSVDLHVNRCSV